MDSSKEPSHKRVAIHRQLHARASAGRRGDEGEASFIPNKAGGYAVKLSFRRTIPELN
jgi:hypothetical protein